MRFWIITMLYWSTFLTTLAAMTNPGDALHPRRSPCGVGLPGPRRRAASRLPSDGEGADRQPAQKLAGQA